MRIRIMGVDPGIWIEFTPCPDISERPYSRRQPTTATRSAPPALPRTALLLEELAAFKRARHGGASPIGTRDFDLVWKKWAKPARR